MGGEIPLPPALDYTTGEGKRKRWDMGFAHIASDCSSPERRYCSIFQNDGKSWVARSKFGRREVIHDPRVEIRLLTCEGKDARLLHIKESRKEGAKIFIGLLISAKKFRGGK